MRAKSLVYILWLVVAMAGSLPPAEGAVRYGHLVQMKEMVFDPDSTQVPGDAFSVLVIQNREEAPIQHEVRSHDLFESGTLISIQGTGTVEYEGKTVSRVLLSPGEEAVIWFYAIKDRVYSYQCNLNGHAMHGTVKAE